jgi:hypothetical protein
VTPDKAVSPVEDDHRNKKTNQDDGTTQQDLEHKNEEDKKRGPEVKIKDAIKKGLGKSKDKKRKREETSDDEGKRRKKTPQTVVPNTSKLGKPDKSVAYLPRLDFYKGVNEANDQEGVDEAFAKVKRLRFKNLAIALNDCRPEEREKRVAKMTKSDVRKLGRYIHQMYDYPKFYNPFSNFPTLIYYTIVDDMIAKKNLQSPNCYVCGMEFEDFQRYEWKNCKGHIMHYKCLVESIKDGKEVLAGPCDCPIELSR